MPNFVQPNLGSLRHVLFIEAITSQSANVFNEQQPVYTTVGTRRAKIDPQRPEALQINQASTRANLEHVQVTFRYFPGLSVNHRFRWGSMNEGDLTASQLAALTAADYAALAAEGNEPSYYRIVGIADPENQGRWMQCDAVQVTG